VTLEASATVAGPSSISNVDLNLGHGSVGVSASTNGSPSSTANVTVTRNGVTGGVSSTMGPVSYGVSDDGSLIINWSESYSALGDTFTVDATSRFSGRAKLPKLGPVLAPVTVGVAVPTVVFGVARAFCGVPGVPNIPVLGSACPVRPRAAG